MKLLLLWQILSFSQESKADRTSSFSMFERDMELRTMKTTLGVPMVNLILISTTVRRTLKILLFFYWFFFSPCWFPPPSSLFTEDGVLHARSVGFLVHVGTFMFSAPPPTEETGVLFQLWPWSLVGSVPRTDAATTWQLFCRCGWTSGAGEREGEEGKEKQSHHPSNYIP